MAAGVIVVPPLMPARDRNGRLVPGALLEVRVNGTTTRATVYADEALSVALANPVVANSSGHFPLIWAEAGTADDPTLYTVAISGPVGQSIANPSVFVDWQPSLDANVALAAISNSAASTAAGAADNAVQAYADIVDYADAGTQPAAIAGKASKAANLSDLINPEAARNTLGHFSTRAVAIAATISPTILSLTTDGYATTTDGGGAVYRRAASEPAHPGKFQSADGAWWEMVRFPTVSPEQFGAKGDAVISADDYTPTSLGTDDQTAWTNADAYLTATGGGTIVPCAKTYRVSNGVRLYGTNSIEAPKGFAILKSGTGTLAITPYGVADGGIAPEVYSAATLPSNINAVLVLDGPSGRWDGHLSGMTLIGSLSGTDLDTDMQTDLGIVSTGSVSDTQISNVQIWACKQAVLFPDIFASTVHNLRADRCLAGFGFNKFTNCEIHRLYASDCRDYAHVYRDGKYSIVTTGASDALNTPTLYSDRTRHCKAYSFLGCDTVEYRKNGQEQTWGTAFRLEANVDCQWSGNMVIGLGSDYAGASSVAIWDIGAGNIRCKITDNPVIGYKATGLLSGSADPADHFNILSNTRTDQRQILWSNNTIRENSTPADTFSRGWAGAWAGPSPAAGTFGGSVNAPLEWVEYDIVFDAIANTLIKGGEQGVSFTKNTTGDVTFTVDTAFTDASFPVNAWCIQRLSASPLASNGMSAYRTAQTTTSARFVCQYTDATYYDWYRMGARLCGYVDRMA